MRVDKLVGERFKEKPSDCVVDSHALMLRGGYIKGVAQGIYSSYSPQKRIAQKIEAIIREEMDAIDGQEVSFPVALPASLWMESGRYESVGSELLRFEDRNKSPMVLGMTHEEAAVQLVRDYANSYTKYPFMIYQVQTKFRDEARPRAGLIRVREFTMKDAYSFHTSEEDLVEYYDRCLIAYKRIFARAGIPDVVVVASDSGMMGGRISHEYMLLSPIGEDSIAICGNCDFRANLEAAQTLTVNVKPEVLAPLTEVATPNMHTIEEVSGFLHVSAEQTCKAVVYQKNKDDSFVVVFLRGDMEISEAKLTAYLGEAVHPAVITENAPLVAGFIGPCGLDSKKMTILYDCSLEGAGNLVCGANKSDYHCSGFCPERELGAVAYRDFAKIKDGGICPHCKKEAITVARGIEVGNIFQLGDKYTKAMDMQYLDKDGNLQYPIMGCYGIGVGRLAASVCEISHDDYGPVWPITIAPWQVQVCCVRSDNEEVKAHGENTYKALQNAGVEVLFDDRDVSAGVMFSDADLLGAPIRVVISPRNLKENCFEIVTRDKSVQVKVAPEDCVKTVSELIAKLKAEVEKSLESL